MKLGAGLFLAYLVILALCFSYPLLQIGSRMRTAYMESAEEPLVDTANILDVSDLAGFRRDFLRIFGFEVDGVDYEADVSPLG